MRTRRCGTGRHHAAATLPGAVLAGALVAAAPALAQTPWSFSGADISNSHGLNSPAGPSQLSPANVRQLAVKWRFTTHGSVSATPTVEPGGVYVPDWAGYIYKLDPATGALIWSHSVSEYSGNPASSSRTSPAISATSIVIGDRAAGRVYALNKATGALIWSQTVNAHPSAAFSAAPVIYNGMVYVGVGSTEESLGVNTTYVPTFRGTVAALDLATGAIRWSFTTVPPGYAGGGSWGSNPVVSPHDGSLFVATGNNYAIPAAATACVKAAGASVPAQLACLDPTDYIDAVLALDLKTGALKWSRRLQGADTWTNGCNTPGLVGCPTPRGADADFASAPNLLSVANFTGVADDRGGTSKGLVLGAGQKSGVYWGLNPANGGLFWSASIGHGAIQWGSAADLRGNNLVFVALANTGRATNTLAGRGGVPVTWNAGAWGAVDTRTGKLSWQIPAGPQDLVNPAVGALAPGFMSGTNNLVFAGDTGGNLVALSAKTGFKYWSFAAGATVESAPAIFNDTLYWGVGYPHGVAGSTVYAFAVP